MKPLSLLLTSLLLISLLLTTSCTADSFEVDDGSVRLEFSADTLSFDTVFATVGTATRRITVYNRSSSHLRLSSVTLDGGRSSRFRLNVDGDTSLVAKDIEIESGDSIFIFAQACINPGDQREPFLVEDAILFSNGQRLPLTAWGRNAVYHRRQPSDSTWYVAIDCQNWDHSLPHVFLDPAAVLEGNTLTLTAGDELYFADGALLVIDSAARLIAQGSAERPILFTSLRQDGWYRFLPGQWQTLWFYNHSVGNIIDHAIVENAVGGLRGYPGSQLSVSNTVIRNMSDCGIIGQSAPINGRNLLVYDCLASLTVLSGGSYGFSQCTFANYWTYNARQLETVVLSNCMSTPDGVAGGHLHRADFDDCIVWGTYASGELLLNAIDAYDLNYSFRHSIVRGGEWDEDPLFTNPQEDDYTLQEDSPAAGIGYQF